MSEQQASMEVRFDCAACSPRVLRQAADREAQITRSIVTAMRVRQEAENFERRWPGPASATPLPAFTWEALERQLRDLAGSKTQADLVAWLLAPIRRAAGCKPPEMLLRELLCLASVVMEEAQPPATKDKSPP